MQTLASKEYLTLAHWAVWETRIPHNYREEAEAAALEGIAKSIATYDPKQGANPKTWAKRQALFYVKEWQRAWFHTRRSITDFDVELVGYEDFDLTSDAANHFDVTLSSITAHELLQSPDLTERELEVLERIFLHGETLSHIADAYHLTPARICQIKFGALAKLRSHHGGTIPV